MKKRANGALVGGTYEVAHSIYLFPGSFPMIYEYPLHGVRGGAGAKSIHRSFASHPAAGAALCLVPGAHSTWGEKQADRNECGLQRYHSVPVQTKSQLCLQVRYNASVQGKPPGQRSSIPL